MPPKPEPYSVGRSGLNALPGLGRECLGSMPDRDKPRQPKPLIRKAVSAVSAVSAENRKAGRAKAAGGLQGIHPRDGFKAQAGAGPSWRVALRVR